MTLMIYLIKPSSKLIFLSLIFFFNIIVQETKFKQLPWILLNFLEGNKDSIYKFINE